MNDKETGSFYTPKELIEYMVTYTSARIKPKTILEPSAGDGRFVEPLKKFNAQISLVEFDPMKAASLSSTFAECCTVHCTDFIKYANQCGEKYDLIIGNPPYIAKKKVPENQCLETEKILKSFNLDKSIFQNLWVSFVISSIKLLSAGGAIFFVLPFEFLQVHYAEKLRAFLETKFNTIEIITFEERVFEGIEQDICLVYLSNEPKAKAYVHEIRGSTNTLGLKIVMAKEELEYDKNIEGALKYIDEAITCQQSFGSWFKVTIESVKKDRRTMKDVNLPQLLDNLKASWEDTCPDTGISVECDPITFQCFPYEIESLVNNLVANSTSAFKSVNQVERKIHIKVCQRDNFIDIFYQDNGPGLSTKYKKNPDLIMDAMETDKMDADGEIIGTGMGMWIIGKTVRDYKGTIDLSENIDAEVGFHVTISLKGRR